MTDYNCYVMSKQEKAKYTVAAAIFLFTVGLIFFSNGLIAVVFSLGAFFYPRYKCIDLIKRRKIELNLQFKDALYSLASALGVGRSLESSFKVALKDLQVLYPDDETFIVSEFKLICRRLELNEPVESGLLDLARRSGLEDISNFVDIMVICKRTGGNMVEVVKNTSNIICEKIDLNQDIDLLLTKQKYEQKILNFMPVVFIGLIKFGGSGYMDVLYSSAQGYLIMAFALIILAASYFISKKILNIRV